MKLLRPALGFLTVMTLALVPAVSPVGPFVVEADAAVASSDQYLSLGDSSDAGSGTGLNDGVTANGVIPSTGDFSVEAWIYPDSLNNANVWHQIVQQSGDSASNYGRFGLNLKTATNSSTAGYAGVQVIYDGVDLDATTNPAARIWEDRWTHIAVTVDWDASSTVISLYLNGTLAVQKTGDPNSDSIRTDGFTVGYFPENFDATDRHFHGGIDQVKVWGGLLDATQLQQSMNSYSTAGVSSPPTLRAHLSFNDDYSDEQGNYTFTQVGNISRSALVEESEVGNSTVLKFPRSYLVSDGGWTVPTGVTTAEVLIVGGGGGGAGGEWAGGGGAGAVLHNGDVALTPGQQVGVTVGAGGSGGANASGSAARGGSGGYSAFGTAQAPGGGGGGAKGWNIDTYSGIGISGGSGGGGGEHGSNAEIDGTLLYRVTNPLRNGSNQIEYATNAASSFSGTISRISYKMQTTVSGTPRWAEVTFDPWQAGLTANDLRVPDRTVANEFEIQKQVSNVHVDSNMTAAVSAFSSGVNTSGTTGTLYDGYLEVWPWDYSTTRTSPFTFGSDTIYDSNDLPAPTKSGVKTEYGSFQVHNLTAGKQQTILAWNHHFGTTADIGFGNYLGSSNSHTDWTFSGTDGKSLGGSGWSLEIRVNKIPFTTLSGATSTATSSSGWTGYGNAGGSIAVMASQAGSGGGGAGAAGGSVPRTSNQTIDGVYQNRVAGNGGAGRAFSITGSSVTYAGGGGGGTASTSSTCSSGGAGGGGAGACGNAVGSNGTDGLGGGGGGANGAYTGGHGGDGVVIVSYASLAPGAPTNTSVTSGDGSITVDYDPPIYTGGGTLSVEYSTDGGSNWRDIGDTQGPTTISLESDGTAIQNATAYTVTLRAKNTVGGTGYSSSVVTVGTTTPSPRGEVIRLDATRSDSFPGTGTAWADISGVGIDGTVSGATWDSRSKSFSLDGSTDYVQLDPVAVDFSQGFAIHATFDFGAVASDWERIVDLGTTDDSDYIAFMRAATGTQLTLQVRRNSGTVWTCNSVDGAIQPGFHTYSAIVSSDGTCAFKVDGQSFLKSTNGATLQLPDSILNDSWIGKSNLGNPDTEGKIQSLIVYNSAQTTPTCKPVETTFEGNGSNGEDGVSYKVLAFTTVGNCSWTVPSGVSQADVLVVGGGGGGGSRHAGGGGAGELVKVTDYPLDISSIDVAVGVGGLGAPNKDTAAAQGGTSEFKNPSGGSGLKALGGGGGDYGPGGNGGSGAGGAGTAGGGSGVSSTQEELDGSATTATSHVSNGAAGTNESPDTGSADFWAGGGGGGAQSSGSRPTPLSGTSILFSDLASARGGNGGAGLEISWLPNSLFAALNIGEQGSAALTFAGGGGGGMGADGVAGGAGGVGGGGTGYKLTALSTTDGFSSSGGGGGGSGFDDIAPDTNSGPPGGDGGSGVVVVRYSLAPGAPTISAVNAANESLRVAVTASSHTAGTTTTGYTFEYSTDSNFASSQTVDSATTSATITGLTNGTTYYIRARANIAGPEFGEWSVASTGVPVSTTDHYLDLDGTNDYVNVAGQIISTPSRFTVEAWVYDTATSDGAHGILRLGSTSTSDRIFIQATKTSSSNKITVGINGSATHYPTNIDLPQNEWVHVALTRDGNDWDFFMNGVLVKSGTVTATTFGSDGLYIGTSTGTGSNMWQGRVDQVKIWDYTMSQSQVQTSMHTHSDDGFTGGASAPDLISHYDFNAVSTSSIADQFGSNNLTVNGSMTTADFVDVAQVSTTDGVRTVTFPRTYLTAFGGYTVASGVTNVRALVLGAGGGGGSDSGSGGGGGARIESDVAFGAQSAPVVTVVVGQGGLGGSWSSATDSGERTWSTSGQASTATFTDSSSGTVGLSAAGGNGGSANTRSSGPNTNGGTSTGAGAAQPSNPSDSSTPLSTSNTLRVAGGAGGAARPTGYSNTGPGGNGQGGGTSTAFGSSFGGGGGGGASGNNNAGGLGVNGGGNGASTSQFAVAAASNRGGGGGAGAAYAPNGARFLNMRDGLPGGSGLVALRYEVVAAPVITTNPSDTSILAGNNASFTVASSTAGVTYQWQVSTNSGGSWADVAGATSATLTLTSLAASSDGYQYRAVVSNTVNGETATATSEIATLGVQDGVTVTGAFCDGSYTKNGITIDAGHGEVFYIDTGQGQEIDAGYVAYIVESATARSDLWVEITDFTGGVVSLANPDASTLPLGAVTAGGTDTAFFMIKASGATTTAQSHVINVYSQKPTIGSPSPIYTCGYSFIEVAETIKAAANKVQSITSTSVSKIGSTMTITVQGDTGTIGQGNDIDGRMIWLTPAARSDWPTDALRLESTAISFYSNSSRSNLLTTHADTLRVNASTSPALSGNNRQYYTATYTFRIIGPAASVAPIIPIAMISSGTQIKHTDVGALPTGGSATVDLRSATVDLTVTKDVDATTTVNNDGTTTLSYEITLTNGGSDPLVIDEVVDSPDSTLTFVSGSATYGGAAIADPGKTGASSLAFSGPLTIPGNSTRVIAYDMTFVTCSVGSNYSYDNVATAKTGTVVIGSGSATQSTVVIAGNCGTPQAVVTVTDEPIDPAATTGGASSVTETTATIAGTVDPNSQSGLNVRFRYKASDPTVTSGTAVDLDVTTFSDSAYGVSTPLTGLTGGTTYYYVIEVEDPDGGWITGTIKSFTTLPTAAPPDAVTLSESGLTTTSATLNGTVDPNLVTGGAKVRFDWAVDAGSTCASLGATSTSGILTSESASGGTEDALLTGSSPTAMSYALTGLTPTTNYCYRIVALSGVGFTTEETGSWEPFTTGNVTAQTITWGTSAQPLPAGGTTTVSATASSTLDVTYTSVDTSVCTVDSSTGVVTAVANSGTCTITATQSGGSTGGNTYSSATPKSISFPISPPVVTPATLISGTYQTSGYTQTLRATGGDGSYDTWTKASGTLPPGVTLDADTGVLSGTPTQAGTYTFTVTTESNGVTSASQQFTIVIAKRVVTVTASSPSVIYGSAAPTISPSYSGFIGSDVSSVNTSPNSAPTCTSGYVVGQNAGTTAASSCSSGTNQNYTFTYVNGTVTVTKFPVTITAIDAAKQNIDGSPVTVIADPTLRWTATSPLPAGQTMTDVVPLGVSISRATTAEAGTGTTDPGAGSTWPTGEAPGDYVITPSGTAGSNYQVTYVTGIFEIQTPKEVPSLNVSNKTMTYGDSNTAATFIGATATNRLSQSVAGTIVYTYLDSSGSAVTLTDLSTLDAGTYLVSVTFTPSDTTAYFHDADAPLTETMVLTVERKQITVTAADKKKLVGALDPELTWSGSGYLAGDSDQTLGPVTISRAPGELAASYAITTTGGDTPNYEVTHVAGSFYIYEPVITVTQSRGVLTSRTVRADCRGAKPGAQATFIIETGGVQTNLGTTTVANDGTCPISATLDETVGQGVHQLIIQSTDPLNASMTRQQSIILLASRIQLLPPASNGGTTPRTRDRGPVVTPLTVAGPTLPTPGLLPRTVPGAPAANNPQTAPAQPTPAPVPNAQTPRLPRLPGTGPSSPLTGLGSGTVDFGNGVQQSPSTLENSGEAAPNATSGQGRRTVGELAQERLGGFQPGQSTRIEILGARSGARFVVTDATQVDSFTVIRAIQNSIPAQAADFFAIEDVRESATPPAQPETWSEDERDAIGEFFQAAGLAEPVSLADIDTTQYTQWVQVTGSAATYQPGSVVYLTLTSDPLVLSSAVVGDDGTAVLSGALPVEWLQAGEHRVRLVGIRSLDGVSVDDQGEIQLSNELMDEIQRFDLGTQSTIAVSGQNPEGGTHVALRVVPLVPVAPWWTLIFIGLGLILFGILRRWGPVKKRSQHTVAAVVILSLASPAVIIGWLSTVTMVTWWGLGLGLIATSLYWLIRPKRPDRTKSQPA